MGKKLKAKEVLNCWMLEFEYIQQIDKSINTYIEDKILDIRC